MRDFISARVKDMPPSALRDFFDILATMDDVISLGIGEPDFVTPTAICHAGIRSVEEGQTGYTATLAYGNCVRRWPDTWRSCTG